MARTSVRTWTEGTDSVEAQGASAGAVLEVLTGVPADVFDALRPAAQAAVVARIVPERLRTLDMASAEAVIAVAQRAVNALGAIQELALAACVRREELDLTELDGDWSDGSEHRPSAVKMVASSVAPLLRSTPRGAEARVGDALCLVDELPRTLALALDGQLDRRQTGVIVDHAQLVAMGARPLFDAAVTSVPEMPTLTPGRLRGVCERVAVAVDPEAVERRASSACVTASYGSSPASTPAWRGGRHRSPRSPRCRPGPRSTSSRTSTSGLTPPARSTRRAPTPSSTSCSAARMSRPPWNSRCPPSSAPRRTPTPGPRTAPPMTSRPLRLLPRLRLLLRLRRLADPALRGLGPARRPNARARLSLYGLEHVDGPLLAPEHAIASSCSDRDA